jgi:hypothetical protein
VPFFVSNDSAQQLRMTNQQTSDMVAFLNTLTDQITVSDPKFSDPFAE